MFLFTKNIHVLPEKEVAKVNRIAMVSISTDNRRPFAQYTLKSFQDYSKKWQYDFYTHYERLDMTRAVQWGKIKAVIDLLETNKYDWVVWLDDDIFITNPTISFDAMIQDHGKDADVIISAHKEKLPEHNDVNTGLFLVKNTPWAKKFLKEVWDIGYTKYFQDTGSFWEQSAMQDLLETTAYKNCKQVSRLPARKIQSFITLLVKGDKGDYGQWQPGDFAAHLAGASESFREHVTSQFAQNPYVYPDISIDPAFNLEMSKQAERYTIRQDIY